jgi:hypothetical protein
MGNLLAVFNTPGTDIAQAQSNSLCIEIRQSVCTSCCGEAISKDWTKTTSAGGQTLMGWGFSEQDYVEIRAKATTAANRCMFAGHLCGVLGVVVQLYLNFSDSPWGHVYPANDSRRLRGSRSSSSHNDEPAEDLTINVLDIITFLLFISSILISVVGFKMMIVSAIRSSLARKGNFEVFWKQGFKGDGSGTPTLIVIVNKQQAVAQLAPVVSGTIIRASVVPSNELEDGLASPGM